MSEAVSGVEIQKMDVSLKAIRVGSRQMTKNIFAQLPYLEILEFGSDAKIKGEPWGWVNYWPEKTRHQPFVWELDGVLYRDLLPDLGEWRRSVIESNEYEAEVDMEEVAKRVCQKHPVSIRVRRNRHEELLVISARSPELPSWDNSRSNEEQYEDRRKILHEYNEWFERTRPIAMKMAINAYHATLKRLESQTYGLELAKQLREMVAEKGQLFICT